MTGEHRADGHDADRRRSRTVAGQGGWYQRPTGDARRSTLNTNDLRGKVLRIKVKDGDIAPAEANKADFGAGRRVHDPGRESLPARGAASRRQDAARGLRDGLPEPVPPAGGRERRRVRHRLLAGRARRRSAAAGPQASAAWRSSAIRPTTATRSATRASSATTGGTSSEFAPGTTTVGTPLDNPPQPVDCGAPTRSPNDSRWIRRRRPGQRARPAPSAARHRPGHLVLLPRQQRRRRRSARRASATTRRRPGPIAPGSTTECPRLFPELFTGGVGPHGAAKYHYDPANPNTKKFPPYYDNSVFLGEFTQDTLREIKLDSQNRVFKINSSSTAARRTSRTRRSHSSATTRWTCSRRRRRLLPADLRRRLLRRQPGRGHVPVGVRQGPARAEGRAHHRQDRRRRCR